MKLNEFKDRLFDVINESDNLPVQDIRVHDAADTIIVYLSDGSLFKVICETGED